MRGRANLSAIHGLCRLLSDATACPTCGKKTIVLNLAAVRGRAGHVPEPVTVETHCACPGGPAAHLMVQAEEDAASLGFEPVAGDVTDLLAPAPDAEYGYTFPRGKYAGGIS